MLGGEAGGAATLASARELLDRAEAWRGGVARRGLRPAARPCPTSIGAIDDYLTYLHVERGLAPATIRAYRGDLHDFAASRGVSRGLGDARRTRPSATSPPGRGAAGAATRASPRAACAGAPPRSRASTASPTAKGSSASTSPPISTCPDRSGSCPRR